MSTHRAPTGEGREPRPSLLRRLRRWLLTGLILVAPAFITLAALKWLFDHMDRPFRTALARWTGYDIPGTGVIVIVILLTATGALASNFVTRSLVAWIESTLDRIPLVRTLYSGVKQLLAPLGDEQGSFQKVVLVQYPDPGTYSLGFLIRPAVGRSPTGEPLAAVLIPTNHLHLGNVVLCPATRIFDVDLSAEDGLRFLVSMGAALDRQLEPRPLAPAPPAPPAVG